MSLLRVVVVGGGVVGLACAFELRRAGADVALVERGSLGSGASGLFVAAGHGMIGVTLAPATAALLAPLVLDGRAAPELAPFDPARSG